MKIHKSSMQDDENDLKGAFLDTAPSSMYITSARISGQAAKPQSINDCLQHIRSDFYQLIKLIVVVAVFLVLTLNVGIFLYNLLAKNSDDGAVNGIHPSISLGKVIGSSGTSGSLAGNQGADYTVLRDIHDVLAEVKESVEATTTAVTDSKANLVNIQANTEIHQWGDTIPSTQDAVLPGTMIWTCNIRYMCDFNMLKVSQEPGGNYLIWRPVGTSNCAFYTWHSRVFMPDEVCTNENAPLLANVATEPPYAHKERLPSTTVAPDPAPTQGTRSQFCTAVKNNNIFSSYDIGLGYVIYSGSQQFYKHTRPFFYDYGNCDILGRQFDPLA